MRFYIFIPLLLMLISCKQNAFVKRHYMQGHYFDGSHAKKQITETPSNKKDPKCKNDISSPRTEIDPNKKTTSNCTDTLTLTGKTKIPCKVLSIDQKHIHYKTCFKNDTLIHLIANEYVNLICFYNGKKEFFNLDDPETNQLLVSIPKEPHYQTLSKKPAKKIGFSVFGYVFLLITGFISLFTAPVIGILLMAISISGLCILAIDCKNQNVFKFFKGIGIFIGVIGLFSIFLFLVFLILIIIAFS